MTRCWNCGLPDVAERCPRCGAPQEQARRGTPPPAGPPGGFQPPPGFIVNGATVDGRPSGPPSGPLPPRNPSGPLPSSGSQSGLLRPQGHPSGLLPSRGNSSGPLRQPGGQSGPLPPTGGYPPRGMPPGGRSHPNAGPPQGWEDPEMQPGPRRNASMPLPSRSGSFAPLPTDDERLPPEYQRGAPPPWSGGRPPTRPMPQQAPRGWEDDLPPEPSYGPPAGRAYSGGMPRGGAPPAWEDAPPSDLPGARHAPEPEQQNGAMRDDYARREAAPKQMERRAEPIWDDEQRFGWREPEELTLSAAINAILGGAVGGALGGVVWVGAVVATGLTMPYLAIVVGLLAGVGARLALVQTRPWIIGAFGAVGAALAFLLTQYALFDYGLIHQGLATGLFALSPLRFPQVYLDYVMGVADDVNHSLGYSGEHPLDMAVLLGCMGVCWLVLLRRKNEPV